MHGVCEGWQHQSKPPCIVFGDLLYDIHNCVHNYCLTIKYSSILFKMKNNISISIMAPINQVNTQYKKLQQVIHVSELVSLKKILI